MIKYFCDKCGKEVPVPYCLYTMGVILCSEECRKEFENEHRVGNMIVLLSNNEKETKWLWKID